MFHVRRTIISFVLNLFLVLKMSQNLTERLTAIINVNDNNYHVWMMSLLAAMAVGFTGVLPMIILPFSDFKQSNTSRRLKLMLSFAVGGLLGDVFLHLLPEAWSCVYKSTSHPHETLMLLGFWVLFGISTFLAIERIAVNISHQKKEEQIVNANCMKNGSSINSSNGHCNGISVIAVAEKNNSVTGYLNLFANSVDNFTHGLAVAASFLVGVKIGMLTTFAIIVHEVPHEFGDFAILMKSGFSKWEAAKAQISTASVGILGAIVALSSESTDNIGAKTAWILPFTAGGFLHIAMVSILPDILKEDNPWESFKQMICIATGIAVMALVNVFIQ